MIMIILTLSWQLWQQEREEEWWRWCWWWKRSSRSRSSSSSSSSSSRSSDLDGTARSPEQNPNCSLVMFRIMPSAYIIKSRKQSSLPWPELMQNEFSMSFHKSGKNRLPNFRRNGHIGFWSLIQLWSWMKVKVIKTDIKIKRKWSLSWYQVWKKSICKCLNTSACSFLQRSYISQIIILSMLHGRDWMSMIIITPASLNSMPHPIQIDWYLSEITDA